MAVNLADNNLKCIFFNENDRIPIWFSLEFVPRSPIDNKAALVQVMAWRQAITWTNADPVHWRIYAALGEDELNWNNDIPNQDSRFKFKCSSFIVSVIATVGIITTVPHTLVGLPCGVCFKYFEENCLRVLYFIVYPK